VQLSVERASESLENFELSDANASVVADICRRLEGVALAIELTATSVDTLGVQELLALVDRFRLLRQGRRTVLRRHRTMAAALDWSYEFLSETERTILRRLSCSQVRSHWTLQSLSSPDRESLTPRPSRASRI